MSKKKYGYWKGKKFTKEHIENLKKSHKGQIPWIKGKKMSKKSCNKISKALAGRKLTEEQKEKLKGKRRREKCHFWKGGKYKLNNRWYIYKPEHPNSSRRYIPQSRLVAGKILGRYLTKQEVIHHINGIKDDDRIENLYLFPSNSEHMRHHGWKIKPILKSNLKRV